MLLVCFSCAVPQLLPRWWCPSPLLQPHRNHLPAHQSTLSPYVRRTFHVLRGKGTCLRLCGGDDAGPGATAVKSATPSAASPKASTSSPVKAAAAPAGQYPVDRGEAQQLPSHHHLLNCKIPIFLVVRPAPAPAKSSGFSLFGSPKPAPTKPAAPTPVTTKAAVTTKANPITPKPTTSSGKGGFDFSPKLEAELLKRLKNDRSKLQRLKDETAR